MGLETGLRSSGGTRVVLGMCGHDDPKVFVTLNQTEGTASVSVPDFSFVFLLRKQKQQITTISAQSTKQQQEKPRV